MASRNLAADDGAAECELLGGIFAYTIQGLLGLAAVGSLVWKRFVERPQRAWRVWSFDVGKQLVGGFFVHFANIAVSSLLSNAGGDQCAWYFINFFIDCTVGVAIVFVVHEGICRAAVQKYGAHSALARIGVYGSAPDDRARWAKQLAVYLTALMVNKAIVGSLLYAAEEPVSGFGNWLFGPLQPHPNTELVVVMVLCPWLLASFQFLVFDALLKAKDPAPRIDACDGLTEALSETHAPYDSFLPGGVPDDAPVASRTASRSSSRSGGPTGGPTALLADKR